MESLSPLKQAFLAIEKLQDRVAALEQEKHAPVAVIGVGLRFPGGARTVQQFWELLRQGVDAITETPPDRWDVDAYYNPDPDVPGKTATRWGGYLQDIDQFDPAFFGIAPREAVSMDPQQRLLLETAWEALENAGTAPDRLYNTHASVFIGVTSEDYMQVQLDHLGLEGIDSYYASGVARSVATGRLSYLLGLRGPAVTLDTACSSSLVAVHMAVQSLRSGESSLALAGGVNLLLSVENSVALSKYHMMAADGRCKPFAAAADGFVRAEGCGVVVLKRLSEALADGDPVLAVIRGSAVNQDGASTGLTAPNGPSQEDVIRAALADAGVEPREIGYVETHGTGTALGDPIEAQALGAVLGQGRPASQPVLIGSVKANIGHLESAAGIAGFIKALLVLQHQVVPPHLHLQALSPHIPWERLPLVIPTEATPLEPVGGRRLVGVSAFGFSGTNCHIVLEAAPAAAAPVNAVERTRHLLAISAKSAEALRQRAAELAQYLPAHPEIALADAAFTLNAGRAHFNHRLAVTAESGAEAADRLQAFAAGRQMPTVTAGVLATEDRPRIAFLFTGQGAQYSGMGRELYATQPTFRAALDACDAVLRPLLPQPLLSVIFSQAETPSPIDHTAYTQPALFAIEYALLKLWQSWGIEPHAVLGHSVGEYTAACAAGVFSLEDGLHLIAERGRLMGELPAGGAMAAVFADEPTTAAVIRSAGAEAAIATLNSPDNTVISGSEGGIAAAVAALTAQGIKARRLNVSHAFHSPLMEPMLPAFARVLSGVQFNRPRLRLAANVTGAFADDALTQPDYWLKQTRGAVRFAAGVQTLYDAGYRVFLEIGPGSTLIGMGQRIVPAGVWLASLRQNKGDWDTLLAAAGALYTNGAAVDWLAFDRDYQRQWVTLPTYPFQRQRCWVKQKAHPARTRPVAAGSHPLLGERLPSPLAAIQFETNLAPEAFSFLNDHRIYDTPVLPATAYMELALAAAAAVVGAGWVENMGIFEALTVPDGARRAAQFVFHAASAGRRPFELFSQQDDGWRLHASGEVVAGQPAPPPALDIAAVRARCDEQVSAEQHYERLYLSGLHFGPSLQGVRQLWRRDGEALSLVRAPDVIAAELDQYRVHPSLLDACLQTLAAAVPAGAAGAADIYLPAGISRLAQYGPLPAEIYSYAQVQPGAAAQGFEGAITVTGPDGSVLAEISGIHLKRASAALLSHLGQADSGDWLYQVAWHAAPLAEPTGLAAPQAVQAAVAPLVDVYKAEYGQDRYADLSPRLDALCVDYVVQALHKLGWRPQPGERVTADELCDRLGILPQHKRLVGRLCAMLAADGLLRRDGAALVVAAPPDLSAGETLARRVAALFAEFGEFSAELTFAQRCGDQLAEALRGAVDPLQLLFPGGSLALTDDLYQKAPGARAYNSLVQRALETMLAELPADRRLRIVEVGAGTGGTTSFVVPGLLESQVESYTFTDISPFFLRRAAENFAAFPFMRYALLNIEDEPLAQGFAGGQADVIIAANVIHATADLRRTLRHLRQMLAPGGALLMLEMIRPERWVDLSFGLTDGWWRFVDSDIRPDYPLIAQQDWLALLAESGFTQAACVPPAGAGALPENAVIVAQAGTRTNWLILADQRGVGAALAAALTARGDYCALVEAGAAYARAGDRIVIAPSRREDYGRLIAERAWDEVVYLWGLDTAMPDDAEAAALRAAEHDMIASALALTQALIAAPARLWLVTQGAQAVDAAQPVAAAQATLWGLGRVVALEHPELKPVCLDLDPAGFEIAQVAAALCAPDAENQIALRGAERFAPRLERWQPPLETPGADGARTLVIAERGVIDNLSFAPLARRQPGPGEVEIRVRAAGLNFKDVLNVMGMYPGDAGALGGECAGEITAVGAGVEGLRVGDAVLALASGSFSSYVVARADLVVPKPARLSFEQAATLAIPFITAFYCLHYVGDIQAGERVLIHAAAGGVGMAAVRLAQRAGAEVFATAGSPEKRSFLESIGVKHVLNSRTLDFVEAVAELTAGAGVDMVLNSLADAFVPASVAALARGGRFLEIGKRGILSAAEFARQRPDARYAIIDWTPEAVDNPQLIRSILLEILAWVEDGTLQPLPARSFPLAEAAAAFRYMAQARHIGRVALTFDTPDTVRADAAYLITGGLGGLGLLTARWLVEQGARYLALMGRRAPSEAARAALAELGALGAHIEVIQGDVAVEADVRRALDSIRQTMPPLRGVFHSAGALADAALMQQDWGRFAAVFAAKVEGTWLLHRLTQTMPLDFFVLFSSVAALFGSRGQANHAAANSFMDALAHHRRAAGLPGLSINWGVWGETGAAVEHGVSERAAAQGVGIIPPADGLRVLGALLQASPAQVGVSPVNWPVFLRQFNGPLFALFAQAEAARPAAAAAAAGAGQVEAGAVVDRLQKVPAAKRHETLAAFVREQVAYVLGAESAHSIDEHTALNALGLDSLMAVELRNRLGAGLELERTLPATLVFDYPTVTAITHFLLQEVLALDANGAPAQAAPAAGTAGGGSALDLLDAFEALSDEEIERLMAEHLSQGSADGGDSGDE